MSSLAISIGENNPAAGTGENLSAREVQKESALKTEILIGGTEAIEKIAGEWTALCDEGASSEPFSRPEWFACFVRNFEKEIILLTVRRDDRLRAVLPIVRKTAALHAVPARKLQAVYNLQTMRFDLIHGADPAERKEIIQALWREIKNLSGWSVLEFRLVRRDSWLGDLLECAESENFATGVWQMDGAPFATLPQGENKEKLIGEFFGGVKKRFRQDLKRRLARLSEEGEVEFVTTRGYSMELMQKYSELEAQSWKGRRGTALTCDAKVARLHDEFARVAAEKNALFIYELKLEGKTIAMAVNITDGRKTFFWKTSYREDYRRFSPGHLLIWEFLADAIRNDSSELDMLSPALDYKKVWATGERPHVAFYVFQRGILGWLYWKWKFSIISRLRKFRNRNLKGGQTHSDKH